MLAVLATLAALLQLGAVGAASTKPNIIFIVADDLGFNELHYNNKSLVLRTPTLDALAGAGVRLHNYYVQPICSPTRSALMTGNYPIRLGTQSNVVYWDTPWGVSLNETFIPQMLKKQGYHTAMFGKWHLGMYKKDYLPTARGFDYFRGYTQGCESYWGHIAAACQAPTVSSNAKESNPVCAKDYDGYDFYSQEDIDISVNNTYSADVLTADAVNYIRQHADVPAPYFLYLPYQNIHAPYEAPEKYVKMYEGAFPHDHEKAVIYAMITALDDHLARVVDALNATGQLDNAVIIFTSDNGAPGAYDGRNYPLRGFKTQLWEGGTRVLGFVHAPAYIKTGPRDSHELYHITDWFPTIAEIAGGDGSTALDGQSMWQSLVSGTPSSRTSMLYNINPLCDSGQAGKPKAGVRDHNWKLLCECYDGTKRECTGQRYLFDLDNDPSETDNVAQARPDKVSALEQLLAQHAADMVEPMQWTKPYQGPDYECAECPLGVQSEPYHAWRPWL